MIDGDSVAAVAAARWGPQFIRPLYDSYCFSQIPGLMGSILMEGAPAGPLAPLLAPLAGPYDRVVLFFIDAFGWRFFEQYADRYPFLRRFVQDGVVAKLTSQFPSTTAAHMTTIHTGLPVGQHGVYEWFYYEPLVDRLIAPLLFSFAGDSGRATLAGAGVTPEALFPPSGLYPVWGRQGIRSHVFAGAEYSPSPYGEVVVGGAELHPYRTLPAALAELTGLLLAEREKAYYFLYFEKIDSKGHQFGPDSPQFAAEVDACLTALETLFQGALAGKLKRTLVLLTADHGQVASDPATTVYLNRAIPALEAHIARNRRGDLLVPAGSCRDMFLHIKPGHLDEAQALLQAHLNGRAEVHRVADLVAAGFFGPGAPSAAFSGRVGDLVVLPYAPESVWWYEAGRFDQHFYGNHGGLDRGEMETVLLAQAYD